MIKTRLKENLTNAKKQFEHCLAQGNAQDFATYRYLVGQIKGLQDAIDICNQTFKGKNND